MGCLHSKKETSDLHPNVFRVVNIDENGAELCSGQLEITESDIILYREGRDSTVWPLQSLRRYGFEGEIFSFESGRRCETGEGIYAFRCRRASLLFRTLQQQIQLRNVINDAVSRLTPSPQGRQTLQASVVHRSSIDNGHPDPIYNNNLSNAAMTGVPRAMPQTPRSPSSVDILEVMPLYPLSQNNGNHVTNVYQLRDFKRGESNNNNNQAEASADTAHVYCNDINRDLALLRTCMRKDLVVSNIKEKEEEKVILRNRDLANKQANNLSPTLSNSSEHYAQLSIEQQEEKQKQHEQQQQLLLHQQQQDRLQHQLEMSRLYMNITPNDGSFVVPDISTYEAQPRTPLTPKPGAYFNFRSEVNTYANLSLGDMADSIKSAKKMLLYNLDHKQKISESDTFTSMSPEEEIEVNYAILDIDNNKEVMKTGRDLVSPESQSYNSSKNESTASYSSQSRGRLVSQSSQDKPATSGGMTPASIGYTTIDFDKTVALTSVAAGAEIDLECPRKTRHNSTNIMGGSPHTNEKNKSITY